jgi:hypothetical protein
VTSGFQADPAAMETMVSTLQNAALMLDSAGSSAPNAPDAGDMTAHIAAVIGYLTNSAGELVAGVAAASDALAQGGERYLEAEDSASRSFQELH